MGRKYSFGGWARPATTVSACSRRTAQMPKWAGSRTHARASSSEARPALLAAQLELGVRELLEQRRLPLDVHEDRLGHRVLDAVVVHVAELPPDDVHHRRARGQQDGPHEADEVAGGLDHPGVERLREDEGGPDAVER